MKRASAAIPADLCGAYCKPVALSGVPDREIVTVHRRWGKGKVWVKLANVIVVHSDGFSVVFVGTEGLIECVVVGVYARESS